MPGSNSSNVSPLPGDSKPAIDVLIPHYNAVDGLALTLASVDAQGWGGPVRVVIVDDGSDRASVAQVERLLDERGRPAVFLENGVNRGRPFTRNVLLDAMESPYAAWIDSGEEWYPPKLSAQMNKADMLGGPESAEPFWVTCHFDWQWTGKELEPRYQSIRQDQIMGLLRGKDLRAYLWTLLGPSQTFKDVGWFDETLPRLQDLDFFVRFLMKGGRLHMPATDESLCVYHKSDIGRDADEIRACHARIFDKHRVLYTRYGPKFAQVQLYNMELHAARFAAGNNDPRRRRRYLLRAFKHRPRQFVRRMLSGGLPG